MDTILNHPATLSFIVALPLFGVVAKMFGATFERIAKWYLYIAVFAVVVVMNSIFFPFIGGKDYFFRFTVELALIFSVLFWAFEARQGDVEGRFRPWFKKPLFVAVTVFVAVVLLASAFALDPHAAFWSNYERGESGFQMIHYYIFFVLLALFLRTEKEWENIFKFSLVAAGLMILYGVIANFGVSGFINQYSSGGPVPQGWWRKLVYARFQGSLGNPAYVAPYLIFSIFYAAYLWAKWKTSGAATALAHVGYGALIAILTFFFFLSQTRGAFLGLGVGIFAFVLFLVVAGRGSIRKWSTVAFAVIILCGIGIFALRNSSFVEGLPGGRMLQISISDASARTRLWTWGSAWKGFLERPILGWGPENFTAVFDKYFDPRHYVPGMATETWFDRAHSVFFDYLAETGILGLLSYLAIFAVFIWEFFRKRGAELHLFERGLIIAMLVAYLVQGVSIFDVLPMYINLFLFAAFACYLFYNHSSHGQHG